MTARRRHALAALIGCASTLTLGCAATPIASVPAGAQRDADELLVVDCLLPGEVRRLGTRLTYLAPRRPIKTSASVCEIRGGEYTAYDRANFATALKIWLPQAEQGDPEAQTYVGEIYEKGLGAIADYKLAAEWYGRAAEQGYARASINLGYLHEAGLGVERDLTTAMNFYRRASGLSDGDLEYVSSIEYAERAAAEQRTAGLEEQVGTLQATLAAMQARYDEQQSRYARGEAELVDLREEVEAERRRVQAIVSSEDDTEAENARLQTELEEAAARIEEREAELDRLATESAEARRSSESSQAEREDLEARLAAANAELQQARDEQQRLAAIASSEADAAVENARLRAALEDASARIEERQAKLDRLTVESAEARRSSESSQAQREDLEARLDTATTGLEQARDEQRRLGEQLRNAQLEAEQRERGDRMIIEELDKQIADRERDIELQATRISSLEEDLARTESLLVGAPDPEERERLRRQVDEQQGALETARAEQQRLTDRLVSEQIAARAQQRESAERLARLESQLGEREAELANQREELDRLEREVASGRARLAERDVERIAPVVALGPSIDIIDPPLLVTRGTPTLSTPERSALELIGRIDPPDSVLTFKIDGVAQPLSTAGVFRYTVPPSDTALELLAVDNDGASTRLQLDVAGRTDPGTSPPERIVTATTADASSATNDVLPRSAPALPDAALAGIDFGRYRALIIGNDDYETLGDLNTAAEDARTVERVLRERYGFQTELLLNATRRDLLLALSRLRETLTEEDNLLIYYAGHGEIDDADERGYWLPVDATLDDTSNWIANSAITDQLDTMAAKHIMVIADSCYSGTLTRSSVARQPPDMTPALRARWLQAMARSRVRTVLSSGGVRPVYDGAPGARHSIFAQAFIDELNANSGALEGYSLFFSVQQTVAESARALNVQQNPRYSPIRHSGHEAGEFVFVANAQAS